MTLNQPDSTSSNPLKQRRVFILAIWPLREIGGWRGYIEDTQGQRHYFSELGRLTHLLGQVGWRDADSAESHPPNARPG